MTSVAALSKPGKALPHNIPISQQVSNKQELSTENNTAEQFKR